MKHVYKYEIPDYFDRTDAIMDNIPLDDLINTELPLDLLRTWLEHAKEIGLSEPTAMNIATINSQGNPRNRMVLQRYIDDKNVGFYTNLGGAKAGEIKSHSMVSATIWWADIERQVRIEGKAREMERHLVDEYFASRNRNSRISAWASKQSQELESMSLLEERFKHFESKFEGQPVPTPPFWGGFLIEVNRIEYWIGKPYRMHERIVLTKGKDGWSKTRLFP